MRSVLSLLVSRPIHARLRSKLAAAAALLVVISLGVYSLYRCSQPAYAMEDLPSRLLEIKSIYMTGWLFSPDFTSQQDNELPRKYPVTIFAERPNRFWHTAYGFSGPDKIHKDVRVSSGVVAGNGRERLSLLTEEKKAFVSSVPMIENELRTEMLIQTEIPFQLLRGNLGDFTKKGSETVNDIRCDIYEYSLDKAVNRLWLDPKTGLPVRIEFCEFNEKGKEISRQIIDHIQVNVPAISTGLSFDPPEDYQVTRTQASQESNPLVAISSGSNDDVTLGVWHCFNIDDKAALLCWFCEGKPNSKNNGAQKDLVFYLEGLHMALGKESAKNRPCEHIDIASANSDGRLWNWSLVFPKKTGERVGNDMLTVAHFSEKGGSLSLTDIPLRLREERLRSILEEVQRLTKTTVPDSSKPFTLEMLRARLNR